MFVLLRQKNSGYWTFQIAFGGIIFGLTAVDILTASTGTTSVLAELTTDSLRPEPSVVWQAWLEAAVESLLVAILTHALHLWSQRQGWLESSMKLLAGRALAACALLGFVLSLAMQNVISLLYDMSREPAHAEVSGMVELLVRWPSTTLEMAAWCALYYGFRAYARLNRLEMERLQQEAAAKDARLDMIATQLNPHFLFNSLNTVRGLIDEDPHRARDAVTALANVLRASLQNSRQQLVSLSEELATVEAHLSLEFARHGDRLTITTDIKPHVLSAMVPPLLIQTLVENAIKHGVAARPGPGFVHYSARLEATDLHVEIRNNGALGRLGNGLGLAHTHERLELLFGSPSLLHLSAGIGGVTAQVRIPQGSPVHS